ncbi:hypothetical protein [Nonomuraea longispora]|uniref:hypothetical protein n=1 Tax=Nonomuraea longispora TaxID=1848320 RepID=UPI0015F2ECC9|nr:hypothetical protein [Nonomuraea longispora]
MSTTSGEHAPQTRDPLPPRAGFAVSCGYTAAALPLTPWAGLGVPAAWAAGALPTGWPLLVRRDA